jgi:hypothetical protein
VSACLASSAHPLYPISFLRHFSENGSVGGNLLVQQRLTGSALFESLCRSCKMLRTSTIIVVTKIMVEVLKMSLLLWCLRAAARMAMTRDVVPECACQKYDIRFSREWRKIALHLRDKSRGLVPDRLVRVPFVVH